MYIKSMEIKNFRCFDELKVEFNPEYTVLVGINGAGKSSLLDAAAIALGSYIAGFDGIPSNGIQPDDAYRKMYELGSRVDSEPQFPVEINAVCNVDGNDIRWNRSLQRKGGRTLITSAKTIMDYGASLQRKVSDGDTDAILPVIAYYGTDRLHMQKKNRSGNEDFQFSRTSGYLDCLNSASSDKLMMKWFEQMTAIQLQEGIVVPELAAVKRAMGRCYSGSHDLDHTAEFQYKMKTHEVEITYTKGGKTERLPMRMLSDGLRSAISMAADIAYRMAVLNPQLLDGVLDQTPGIVLIDEVDMHLHPEWQKRIMNDLHYIFPKVQFIVTTHAPSVLANVKDEHILLLNDYQVYTPNNTTYGRDVEAILREIMQVEIRPKKILDLKDNFYDALVKEDYPEAEGYLNQMADILGENDADVVQARISYDLEQI